MKKNNKPPSEANKISAKTHRLLEKEAENIQGIQTMQEQIPPLTNIRTVNIEDLDKTDFHHKPLKESSAKFVNLMNFIKTYKKTVIFISIFLLIFLIGIVATILYFVKGF